MSSFALVKNNVVVNIIAVDDNEWLNEHVEEMGYDRAVDIKTLKEPIAPGYLYKQGTGYLPPFVLTSDKPSIKGDSVDEATVTFTDNHPSPLGSVDATVNGQSATIPLTGGTGSIAVTSSNPGDTVTVVTTTGQTISIGVDNG